MQEILKVEKLSFSYDSDYELLNSIDFTLKRGEKVALLGANGTGKSTLMKLMMGLLTPISGQMYLFPSLENENNESDPIGLQNVKEIRKQIGYVFQNAEDQLFCASVFEDVAFGLRNYRNPKGDKLSAEDIEGRVLKALEEVEASHLMDRVPFKLSGGEKRAVAIATVLSMQPRIILMDEPSTALDPYSRRNLIHLLKKLSQTLLITTHDLEMTLEVCDRVMVINQGKIVAEGHPVEILSNPTILDQNRLEMPYSLRG